MASLIAFWGSPGSHSSQFGTTAEEDCGLHVVLLRVKVDVKPQIQVRFYQSYMPLHKSLEPEMVAPTGDFWSGKPLGSGM